MAAVQIGVEQLSREALDGLIEEFVTREGTDYGLVERSLVDKIEAVRLQLRKGDVVIVYDEENASANLILKEALQGL